MNEKLFKKAVDIAHGDFWLADDASVCREAKRVISSRESRRSRRIDRERLLGEYVSIICRACVRAEAW